MTGFYINWLSIATPQVSRVKLAEMTVQPNVRLSGDLAAWFALAPHQTVISEAAFVRMELEKSRASQIRPFMKCLGAVDGPPDLSMRKAFSQRWGLARRPSAPSSLDTISFPMGLLINGEYVDDQVIRQEAAGLRSQLDAELQYLDPMEAQIRVWQLAQESVVERTLMRQAALKDETPVDEAAVNDALTHLFPPAGDLESCEPGVTRAGIDRDAARADVVARLKVDQLLQQTFARAPEPREKDLTEFYKKNREHFRRPSMIHASHIVKNAGEQIAEEEALASMQKALAELESGRPFAEVADELSDCSGQGGDLGWFAEGQMVDEFERIVMALKPGERSPIFKTEFGFHVAMLHEMRPAGIAPFEEVRAQIVDMFVRQGRELSVRQLMQELRAGAEVKKAKGPVVTA